MAARQLEGTWRCDIRSVRTEMESDMGKGILLWLIGIPIPVIILLYLLF
jgi:hypothetical protein